MTQEELLALIPTYDKAVENIKALVDLSEIDTYLKQYDPTQHDIFDKSNRPDKIIKNDQGTDETIPVTRIGIALQKLIVSRAAAFLCGNPIQIKGVPNGVPETNMLAGVNKVWLSNKLDFRSKELARLMFSETACAELWYAQKADPDYWTGEPVKSQWRLRVKILAASLGDDLYPVFSPEGDMIAFGRGYKIKVDDKDEEHFDLYTDTTTYLGANETGGWIVTTEKNVLGKIPVIYYSQPKPAWDDVQTMIDQLETVISNMSDTNGYFGDPMIIIEGEIKGFAKKGQTGKTLQLENGAKVSYLTWDQAPEAIKMEIDNLLRFIYNITDTPDISFEQMKSIGGNAPSGFALEMLFLGAHLKASDNEELYGQSTQRRLNFIITALAAIDTNLKQGLSLKIRPQFEYFIPKNNAEKIDILNSAVTGGIMSTESAVRQNPLVDNAVAELELIKTEKDTAAASPSGLNLLMNGN